MPTISPITNQIDAEALDNILWRVLWKPLGFAVDIRQKFALEGEEFELAARKDDIVVGGLVAVWTGENEIELRHIAVDTDAQYQGVGRKEEKGRERPIRLHFTLTTY